MIAIEGLLAKVIAVTAGSSQVVHEFARALTIEGWWWWALVVGVIVGLLALCVLHYRRDVAELSRPVRWTLLGLRVASLIALIFFFFDLQRRTERLVTRPSEVVVMVDTSQSMSLPVSAEPGSESRADLAKRVVAESNLLKDLSQDHRVHVYKFDAESEPALIESIDIVASSDSQIPYGDEDDSAPLASEASGASRVAQFGAFAIALGLLVGLLSLLVGAVGRTTQIGWLLLTSASCLVIGGLCVGAVFTAKTQQSLASVLGIADAPSTDISDDGNGEDDDANTVPVRTVDWGQQLAANGNESHIGDAMRVALAQHEPTTLAGVVLLTDGQNNGGSDISTAMSLARRSEVSIYPVGLGSSDPPVNVRVVDLDVPKRIYPGDKFSISAVLQATGPLPAEVDVELLDGLDDSDGNLTDDEAALPTNVVDTQRVRVNNDGTLQGIRFELEPESVGRRRVAVRVVAPQGDSNDKDDFRDARYEVVARRLRVLAIAGGPTREYRFVRNLLYRDKSVELDVWLQTGQPGMSQDADSMRMDFPGNADELFEYDAIVLFDPDWNGFSPESLSLLQRWVTEQAGGLILVAGPVYHSDWFRRQTDPRVSTVRGFFPVQLATRGPLLGGGRQGGENAWPLEFTPDAVRAEFLRIAEDADENSDAWDEFDGVYDFVGVKGLKPGAKAYAYFSDPTTNVGDSLPVFLASQFFGAGRTYFQSSGEMWRLRGRSDAYFDRYYTQLVRWVSEGRLLRDSNRGILLLDNSRAMVGDTIVIRAVLTDDQFEPLQVPDVPVQVLLPSGGVAEMKLTPLDGEPRPGTYGGRFIVREAGSHEVRLTLGDALSEEVLRQTVQVRLPTVELERPQRNDAALQQLADLTAGSYLPQDAADGTDQLVKQLTEMIGPQPQTTILPGTPDSFFTQRRNLTLMWLIAMMLTFEWVTRRLHRLA